MFMEFVFATNNKYKILELSAKFPKEFTVLGLSDINCLEEIPETSETIEGNAIQKAHFVFDKYLKNCFADDTGLEVYALNNEPGVRSARYAGKERSSDKNMDLLLHKLEPHSNRSARFKTVIALVFEGKTYTFEGIVEGVIRKNKIGNNGFGYDPIFEPENTGKTFAQMTLEEKNNYSHRARAFDKMLEFLRSL